MKSILIILCCVGLYSTLVTGQCRIGGVYLDSLEYHHPERKQIDEAINNYRMALINYGESLNMELKVINKEYISNLSCTPAVKQKFEAELQKVSGQLDEFEKKVKSVFYRFQKEYKTFVRVEIDEAIAAVAIEKELDYVVDIKGLLFGPKPEDITNRVIIYMKSRFTFDERIARMVELRKSMEKEFYSWINEP